MKLFQTLFMTSVVLFSFTQCGEEDDGGTDLTKDVVGLYTEVGGGATITVNKVDNSAVSITVDGGYWDFAFTNVTMSSNTAFTLNTYTRNGDGCDGTQTVSGTGTASNNNISLFITIDAETNSPYNGCYDDTYNVSASK